MKKIPDSKASPQLLRHRRLIAEGRCGRCGKPLKRYAGYCDLHAAEQRIRKREEYRRKVEEAGGTVEVYSDGDGTGARPRKKKISPLRKAKKR